MECRQRLASSLLVPRPLEVVLPWWLFGQQPPGHCVLPPPPHPFSLAVRPSGALGARKGAVPQSGPHLAADLTLASLPPSLPQVGEYFQVQDDYLDFYGDEKVRFGPLPLDILYNCYIDYSRPFYGDEKVIRASTVGGSPQLLHGLQQAPPSAATRSHYQ